MRRSPIRLIRPVHVLTLACVPWLIGCVPQDKYDSLLGSYRTLQEEKVEVEDERSVAQQNLASLQDDLTQCRLAHRDLQGRYDDLNGAFNSMSDENDTLMTKVRGIDFGPLPPALELAIEDLVRSHSDLVEFDRKAGMIRFASDLTFASGSATLSPEATEVAQRVARVLADADATGFEVQVVGHTDTVKIGKPETRRAHPTNVHLSVHRAIAVRDALVTAGISPELVQVAGYGEYRPVVTNDARRGAAENRRVEVYIKPRTDFTPGRRSRGPAMNDSAPTAPAGTSTPEPMK